MSTSTTTTATATVAPTATSSSTSTAFMSTNAQAEASASRNASNSLENAKPLEHVVILGLGIIGTLTALAILQRSQTSQTTHTPTSPQLQITIYELRPTPATIGGALNISPNAHRIMDSLGVSPKKYGGSTPWVLFQNEKGERIGEFKYGGVGDRFARGYEGLRVVRNDIQNDVIEALRPYEESGRLKIIFNKRAVAIDEVSRNEGVTAGAAAGPECARITFQDGEVVHADLVIGADGIHSFTRSQIVKQSLQVQKQQQATGVGVGSTEKTPLIGSSNNEGGIPTSLLQPKATYSGVTTIYGLVPTSLLPPSVLAPLNSHQSIRTISPHAGLFAISYARADRSYIHWFSSRTPPNPPSPDEPEPSPDVVRAELAETYKGFPEPIPSLIEQTEKIYYWPVYRLSPMPDRWFSVGGRVVLVGDAAHAMPPHAAQGVGMGVEDALLVANVVAKLAGQNSRLSSSSSSSEGEDRVDDKKRVVQPSAVLWEREYQSKRSARVAHFVAHAESQGRARESVSFVLVARAREWLLWVGFPLINALAWVHGSVSAPSGPSSDDGVVSKMLRWIGLGDVQGWGYDPDEDEVNLEGL